MFELEDIGRPVAKIKVVGVGGGGVEQFALRAHRHVLPRAHRQGAGEEARDARRHLLGRGAEAGLGVVGAQHENDEVDRIERREDGRQDPRAVAIGGRTVIVEHGGTSAEAGIDDASGATQTCLEDAGPTIIVGVTTAGGGVGAPGQAVAIGEDGLHAAFFLVGLGLRVLAWARLLPSQSAAAFVSISTAGGTATYSLSAVPVS